MKHCPNCREEIVKPGRYCAACGAQLNEDGSASPPPDLPEVPEDLGTDPPPDDGSPPPDFVTREELQAELAQDRRRRRRKLAAAAAVDNTAEDFWDNME